MNIKEIQNKKDLLEAEIKQKVLSFEEETGVHVVSIRAVHIGEKHDSPVTVVSDIRID